MFGDKFLCAKHGAIVSLREIFFSTYECNGSIGAVAKVFLNGLAEVSRYHSVHVATKTGHKVFTKNTFVKTSCLRVFVAKPNRQICEFTLRFA